MAINLADFTKIWASTSPLTPYSFSDANYQEGWNFVGSTPPARQMWDSIQNLNDLKTEWLYNNKLNLTGGSITGDVSISGTVTAGVGLPPVGSVTAFAGSTTPTGWLLCDGSAVSRTDYADLYAVIGDTYGAGDGTTTFNLPDLADKFIQGNATAGTVKTAGLPNIEGGTSSAICVVKADKTADETWSGALGVNSSFNSTVEQNVSSARGYQTMKFDASKSNAIYGGSTTVQPPALTMRYIIKY